MFEKGKKEIQTSKWPVPLIFLIWCYLQEAGKWANFYLVMYVVHLIIGIIERAHKSIPVVSFVPFW